MSSDEVSVAVCELPWLPCANVQNIKAGRILAKAKEDNQNIVLIIYSFI